MTFSFTSLVTWWRRLGGWAQPGLLARMPTCGLPYKADLNKSDFLHGGLVYSKQWPFMT